MSIYKHTLAMEEHVESFFCFVLFPALVANNIIYYDILQYLALFAVQPKGADDPVCGAERGQEADPAGCRCCYCGGLLQQPCTTNSNVDGSQVVRDLVSF